MAVERHEVVDTVKTLRILHHGDAENDEYEEYRQEGGLCGYYRIVHDGYEDDDGTYEYRQGEHQEQGYRESGPVERYQEEEQDEARQGQPGPDDETYGVAPDYNGTFDRRHEEGCQSTLFLGTCDDSGTAAHRRIKDHDKDAEGHEHAAEDPGSCNVLAAGVEFVYRYVKRIKFDVTAEVVFYQSAVVFIYDFFDEGVFIRSILQAVDIVVGEEVAVGCPYEGDGAVVLPHLLSYAGEIIFVGADTRISMFSCSTYWIKEL